MIAQKWDFGKHRYEPYELPRGAELAYKCEEKEVVTCAECGKLMSWDESCESHIIYNFAGLGYAVCLKCREKERENERTRASTREEFFTTLFKDELDDFVNMILECRRDVTERDEDYFREGFYYGLMTVRAVLENVIYDGLTRNKED